MSDYPALENCSICGRPLINPDSVVAGIGPICREKAGIPAEMAEEDRAALARMGARFLAADKRARRALVAEVAASPVGQKWPGYPAALRRTLKGMTVAVTRGTVTVGWRGTEREADGVTVRTPFIDASVARAFADALKAEIPSRDRGIVREVRRDGTEGFAGWTVAAGRKAALWALLRRFYGGAADLTVDGGEPQPLPAA